MQYLLSEGEYKKLKDMYDREYKQWVSHANSLLGLLAQAKQYPCTQPFGYCNGCELEHSDTCFWPRRYGK